MLLRAFACKSCVQDGWAYTYGTFWKNLTKVRDHGHEMYRLNCPAVKSSLSENARFS